MVALAGMSTETANGFLSQADTDTDMKVLKQEY